MKRFKKLLLVVVLLVVAGCAVFISGVLPYRIYVLHSDSMSPTISSRSAVIIEKHHFEVGQVVTFTENGLTVTHRLISINAAGLITTKGDANPTNDPWQVPESQIIGGVVATVPELGYWIVYLKSPVGAASVLLGILALWQIWALGKSSLRAAKENRERTRSERRAPPNPRPVPAFAPVPVPVPVPDPIGRHVRQEPRRTPVPSGRHVKPGAFRPTLGRGARHVGSTF